VTSLHALEPPFLRGLEKANRYPGCNPPIENAMHAVF